MFTFIDHHRFTLQVSLGLLAGFLIMAWYALQNKERPTFRRRFDASLAALISGIIGARLLYVVLNWSVFADYPEDIVLKFWIGHLTWQGGLLGLAGGWLVLRLYKLDFAEWSDGLALAVPIVVIAVWWACREQGWGYGVDLEDPQWLTGYLPNEKGHISRRFELQILGMWSGLILVWIATWLTRKNQLKGQRLWLILSLLGLSHLLLGLGRGDEWLPLLDVLVLSIGLLGFFLSFWQWRLINQRIVGPPIPEEG